MQNATRAWLRRACLAIALLAMNAPAQPPVDPPAATDNGQRAFDWEIGTWKTELRRLAKPLCSAYAAMGCSLWSRAIGSAERVGGWR